MKKTEQTDLSGEVLKPWEEDGDTGMESIRELREWLEERAREIDWTHTSYVSEHEYITREEYYDFFFAMNIYIEREGFPVNAFSYDYLYAKLDGFHYWWTVDCINRTPVAGNDEEDWGWDPVADPNHDHKPDNPGEVTRCSYLLRNLPGHSPGP